ncbi:MAG: PRC-barrel domain-containing protein [bacterium]
MEISTNQIIGLPVVTVSGQDLGVVRSVVLNNKEVVKYIVAPSSLVKKLLSGDLIIASEQVVSITEKEMLVEDTVTKIPLLRPVPST